MFIIIINTILIIKLVFVYYYLMQPLLSLFITQIIGFNNNLNYLNYWACLVSSVQITV